MSRVSRLTEWSIVAFFFMFATVSHLDAQQGTSPFARYRVLTASPKKAPPFEVVEFAYEKAPGTEGGKVAWQLTVLAKDQGDEPPLMRLRATTHRDPLADSPEPLTFTSYVLRVPSANETIDYRNVHTSNALLPSWGDFIRYFVPHPARGTHRQQGFPTSCEYLGHVLSLRSVGQTDWPAWRDAKVLKLDPELLIATSRTFKDKEGRRLPQQPERHDYKHTPWTKDDYAAMIEAGFNSFALIPGIEDYLHTQPVFYRAGASTRSPVDLYRSNMLGPIMYLDEPTCIMTGDKEVNDLLWYFADAANLITKRVRAQSERALYHYESLLGKELNFGDMRLAQPDFASWETRYETAFYQLAGGAAGIVHEGRYQLGEFNEWAKASTGMDRQFTAEQMFRYYYAFLRGAARHFNKDWGTSIYGQADPAITPLAIDMAYDMGARYVWYWTSGADHHMPFNEQLDLTRSLREHIATKPRLSIRAARPTLDKAIVVPYGYIIALESPTNRKNCWDLWWVREMDKEGKNEAAQRYTRLRTNVLTEVFKAIDAKENFDILHDDGGPITGYRQVVKLKAE